MKKYLLTLGCLLSVLPVAQVFSATEELHYIDEEAHANYLDQSLIRAAQPVSMYLQSLLEQGMDFEEACQVTQKAIEDRVAPFNEASTEEYLHVLNLLVATIVEEVAALAKEAN